MSASRSSPGALLSGWSIDRVFAPYVAAIAFVVSAGGDRPPPHALGPAPVACRARDRRVTIGAELDILAFTMSRYFGLASFARLYGLAYSTMIFAGGASPYLIARLAPAGDYSLAILVSASGLALSAVLVALLPKFPRAAPATA